MSFQEQLAARQAQVEHWLQQAFQPREDIRFNGLLEAMRYSLLAGGKRLRPVLVLEFCRCCCGDVEAALPVACAVEMLHTYSLIHDDLPCMDNDDLRRGKPTNHKVYGECTAVLAGDALQAEAFRTILTSSLPPDRRAACAAALAEAAGTDGICGGQFLDMAEEEKNSTDAELRDLQARKTGSLLMAACRMGVLAAGGTPEQEKAAADYGAALGAAFQIRDDMLDELASEAELGKPIGSDKAQGKTTFMSLYGAEKCAALVQEYTETAVAAVAQLTEPDFLQTLAISLAERTH